jgi:hypothetical protein
MLTRRVQLKQIHAVGSAPRLLSAVVLSDSRRLLVAEVLERPSLLVRALALHFDDGTVMVQVKVESQRSSADAPQIRECDFLVEIDAQLSQPIGAPSLPLGLAPHHVGLCWGNNMFRT